MFGQALYLSLNVEIHGIFQQDRTTRSGLRGEPRGWGTTRPSTVSFGEAATKPHPRCHAPSAFCGSSLGRACRIDKGAMTPKRLHTPCARCRHHKIRPLSWAPIPCPRHVSRPFAQQSHQAPGASSAARLDTAFAFLSPVYFECSSRQTRTVGRARVPELARLPPPLYRNGQVPSGRPGMPWVPSLSEMEHPGTCPFPRVSHSCNDRIDGASPPAVAQTANYQ